MRTDRKWRRWLFPPSRAGASFVVRYGLAVVAVAAAGLVRAALEPLSKEIDPFLLFTPAVMLAAWFGGGLGPGLFATLIGAVVGTYFWIEPLYTVVIRRPDEWVHTTVFVAVGFALSGMSRALANARVRADDANRAKDRFIAILSHELRNPLAPVVAAVGAIEQAGPATADLRRELGVIRRNVALQVRLIDDLLDANRIAEGKLHLRWEVCDAHEVVEHALEVCRPDARAKRIALSLDAGATHHYVRADSARLQQVFWNLIRNAIKFTPEGGSINLETRDAGARGRTPGIVIRVTDSGIGIPPDEIGRVFEPFSQGSGDVVARAGGLGLGLALAQGIVRGHGGTIRARSAGRGRGATFTVELPATAAATAATAATATATEDVSEHSGAGPCADVKSVHSADAREPCACRLLLVEDDLDTGPLLRRLLGRSGFEVTLTASKGRALEAAAAGGYDLIITDMLLPDGSGIELLREIRLRDPVPGICLSGLGGEADVEAAREAGFERYLVKPVELAALLRAIDEVRGRAGAGAASDVRA